MSTSEIILPVVSIISHSFLPLVHLIISQRLYSTVLYLINYLKPDFNSRKYHITVRRTKGQKKSCCEDTHVLLHSITYFLKSTTFRPSNGKCKRRTPSPLFRSIQSHNSSYVVTVVPFAVTRSGNNLENTQQGTTANGLRRAAAVSIIAPVGCLCMIRVS